MEGEEGGGGSEEESGGGAARGRVGTSSFSSHSGFRRAFYAGRLLLHCVY